MDSVFFFLKLANAYRHLLSGENQLKISKYSTKEKENMAQRVTMPISYQKKFQPDAHTFCLASPTFLTEHQKGIYKQLQNCPITIHLSQQVVMANPIQRHYVPCAPEQTCSTHLLVLHKGCTETLWREERGVSLSMTAHCSWVRAATGCLTRLGLRCQSPETLAHSGPDPGIQQVFSTT